VLAARVLEPKPRPCLVQKLKRGQLVA